LNGLLDELSGIIENVIYRNEDNDYTVLEISSDDNLISCVGIIPLAFEGEIVTLYGRWGYHKEFGRQFEFDAYEKSLPKESEGILRYLSSRTVKGIGPVSALKIVKKFGSETFDVIENHPEWLADIPGITIKKAKAISESFREVSGIRNMLMQYKDYLDSAEITKVYKKLGMNAVDAIKTNPYILCEDEYSVSFHKADMIARDLKIPYNSPYRVISGINFILKSYARTSGHTALPKVMLANEARELLNLSADEIETFIDYFISEEEIFSYTVNDEVYIMTEFINLAEKYIAEKLGLIENSVVRFSHNDVLHILANAESRFGIHYAVLQKEAIYEALNSGTMILTGGPGTGKTTVIKALISIFTSLGMKLALCAPTGRAAKRMSEATSHEAKTVHRLLEMERNDKSDRIYRRNRSNPLEEQVIIVDEASMVDLPLFYALLSAMRASTRLILIGDNDQLPSVGEGNVLCDLIESGKIKTVRLTEVFRQAKESLIISNAHKINSGEAPILSVTDSDFFFVRRENEAEIPDTIASLLTERLPRRYGSVIKEQIQVITPSKKGIGGIEVLNQVLQSKINPPAKFKKEKTAHGVIFREGDKVMQTVNNYDLEYKRGEETGYGIFNGDIGIIESINPISSNILISFDDKMIEYPFDNLSELELAYAITVHKSQGSEYGTVIIPSYNCPPQLMTRNLLYTAITRAKNMVILVGRADVPERMARNNRQILRYTTLKNRIQDF
jgi:exodeoxyribonuclease V alpha subunit